jgi:hypothetical protein
MPGQAFYGVFLREVFACNHIPAREVVPTTRVSRNKPGV